MNIITRAVLTTLLFSSCSGITLRTIDHSVQFNKKTTFVIRNKEDGTGTVKEFNSILIKEGFNTTSIQNATNAIKNRTPLKESDINKDLEKAFNIKDINSVYAINIGGYYFKNLYYYSYGDFQYSITDLNTGQIVMHGYSYIRKEEKTTKVLQRLAKKLKTKFSK
jgi:hypothetical protein